MKEYGTQVGDTPKTLTLRQALAMGRKVPNVSIVVKAFKPGKYGGIALITEAGYKCTIGETSPLYAEMFRIFDTLENERPCLAVRIDDAGRCAWTLVELDENECSWVEHEWGFASELLRSRKAASKQTAAPTQARRRAGADPAGDDKPEWENPSSLR